MRDSPSPISTFVDEIRRRKVARTGITYAIGAWVVWQVVDVVSPALGWSDRVLSFVVVGALALAPVVLVLAWVWEIRPEQPVKKADTTSDTEGSEARESGEPGEPGIHPKEPAARLRPVTTILPAVVVSAGIAWALWPVDLRGVGGFAEGDPTLISLCVNETDDPGLDGVLNTALGVVLGQSKYVSITSRDQAAAFAVRYLSREGPVVVNRQLANELGVRWGYKLVIHCALRQIGGAYQVSAMLTDPQGPRDLAVIAESVGSQDDLVGAIDLVAQRTREALGESLESVQASKPLAAVTTSSLEALKSYTAAVEAERGGDFQLALQLFRAAASRDTLFARAHSAIGSYVYRQGDRPGGADAYQKALRSLDRVSDRDRVWIEASWASARGDQQGAIRSFREYLDQWPDDPVAWYNLGTQYFRRGQCDEAGVAFGRALAINPVYATSHINLASCLAIAADYDSSLVHYDSAFAIQPSWRELANVNHEYGFVLLRAGDAEGAARLFQKQAEGEGEAGASGRRSAALLHMYAGRYGDAAPLLEEAVVRRQALGQRLSEYRDRLYLAGVYEALGREAEADGQLTRVEALAQEVYLTPTWIFHGVRRLLARGRIDTARAFLAWAEADTLATSGADRAAVLMARAALEVVESQPRNALENARLAQELGNNELRIAVLCQVALQAGAAADARRACGELISEDRVGWEIQEATLLTYFWLGRLAEEEGDAATAAELYGVLVELWRDADPDLVFRDLDGGYVNVLAETEARLVRIRLEGS